MRVYVYIHAFAYLDLDLRRGEANDGGFFYLLSKAENILFVYQSCVCVCVSE